MSEPITPILVEKENAKRAFSGIALLVTQLSSTLVGIGAFSYIIGYNYLNAYYFTINATWVLEFYSYEQIAKTGAPFALAVGTIVFISILELMKGTASPKSLEKWAKRTAAIGVIPMLVHVLALFSFIPSSYASIPLIVAGIFFSISGGLTAGELIGRLKETDGQWNGHHLTLLYLVYLFAVMQAPRMSGSSTAEFDMDFERSPLHSVRTEGESDPGWRLVRVIGDKYLLVQLSKKPQTRVFKLVAAGDTWLISSSKQ